MGLTGRKGGIEMTTATRKRRPKATSKSPGAMTVKCAFCDGTGKDPFQAMSALSNCPACNGHGKVRMRKPVVACAYCDGTGKQRHTRLTCQVCRGAGHRTVAGPTATCPQCDGSGRAPGVDLPCTLCSGTGLVDKKCAQARTSGTKRSARSTAPRAKKPSGISAKDFVTAKCAFCRGVGRDPYGVLSKLSNCPVCNGRGTVRVRKPVHPCAFCHGTGKMRRTRLSCGVCKGTGLVTVGGPTAKCPECDGSGKMHGADLPCSLCKGAGLIAKKSTAPKQRTRAASRARGK